MTELAQRWADAMRRARTLRPDLIATRIAGAADTGLRATRYDAQGSRTTRQPCRERETCEDGPEEHSHLVTSDPTGNAAVRGRQSDSSHEDLRRLNRAVSDFVDAANVVLGFVVGEVTATWIGVVKLDARLMPGTVQAGLDVDGDGVLPGAISRTSAAVAEVSAIHANHMPRDPSIDEQHWTAGLADEDCCAWHLAVHRRYRRPRLPGKNICADCVSLATAFGGKPPQWLLEAEVDRAAKPKAWTAALSRYADELGLVREAG